MDIKYMNDENVVPINLPGTDIFLNKRNKVNEKIESIQILRALACIFVILYHYYGHYLELTMNLNGSQNYSQNYFRFGAYGVHLFFIISGFIIYTIINTKHLSSYEFIKKRLIRIFPCYLIATFFTSPHINIHFIFSVLFWPFKSMEPPQAPVLGVGWTLSHEIYFYLVCAICILFPRRSLTIITIYFLVSVIGIQIAHNLWTNNSYHMLYDIFLGNYQIKSKYTLINFISSSLNLFFLAGVWLGYFYNFNKNRTSRTIKLFFFITLLVSFGIIINCIYNYALHIYQGKHYLNNNNICNTLLLLLISAFFISFIVCFKQTKFPRIAILIGNMSYSLYLWQYFSLYKPEKLVTHPSLVNISMYFIINLGVGYISYRLVELRLSNFLIRFFSHPKL